MSSTLYIQRTPKPSRDIKHFKLPIKAIIAKKYYEHDGSLGGGKITLNANELSWFEGILAAGNFDEKERNDLDFIIQILRDGETIDMWFEA